MDERRGFFDECHNGEIDPGYFYLFQNGKQVGEVWAMKPNPNPVLEVIFYDSYLTPGKVVPSGSGNVTNPDVYTEFVYKMPIFDPNGNPVAPSIGARIAALKGTMHLTHTTYTGSSVHYP